MGVDPYPLNPNPTPQNPNTIIITGMVDVEFDEPAEDMMVGEATFTYIFYDGGDGPNADSFSIGLVSSTPELNHFSDLVSLNRNVIVIDCH